MNKHRWFAWPLCFRDLTILDPTIYECYRQVPAVIDKYGGRYLVRGGAFKVFEGDWRPNRLIVRELPDMDAIERPQRYLEVLRVFVFNLKCSEGHGFEEWFAWSADYEVKAAGRALVCPECGSTYIEKGLAAPRINGGAQAPAPAAGPCGLPACGSGVCQMAN